METILATGDLHAGLRRLVRSQVVPLGVDEAFAFFADPLNLEAITPPWLRFRVLTRTVSLPEGALIDYRLRLHRVPVSWRTRIEAWEPGCASSTGSSKGRSRHWEHLHTFAAVDGGTLIADRVDYRMPLGPLGAVAHAVLTRPRSRPHLRLPPRGGQPPAR